MEHEPLEPSTPSFRATMRTAIRTYSEALEQRGDVLEWLDARGIDRATASTHRLGVVVNPVPGHEKYEGMLAIPYLNPNGDAVTVRFRRLGDTGPKYKSLPDDPPRFYNSPVILSAGNEIHVTEGEFDAMILNKCGMPAVGLPGATTFLPRHRVLLAGFSHVWVWGDPDDAGVEMNNKITRSLRQARAVYLKEDVSDTYVHAGPFALEQALAKTRAELGV